MEERLGSQSAAVTTSWDSFFNDTNGFNQLSQYTTIGLADVSSDGRADVCGRGANGIYCGVSTGSSFGAATLWSGTFTSPSWASPKYYKTIKYPNVNGSGGQDVCGRGAAGITCGLSNGAGFGATSLWSAAFSDAGGWDIENKYATIDYPDVNGDGKADVCGRGVAGINCALSNGAGFGAATAWETTFSDPTWAVAKYFRTIKYPDVNGDGRRDVCGRGAEGIYCARSSGTTFEAASLWSSFFSDIPGGWGDIKYYSTISFPDVNGDGKADVCARASTGMMCATSNGSSFNGVTLWESTFSDGGGFDVDQFYATITYPDIDGGGRADICGRGVLGLYCGYSFGTGFTTMALFESAFSSAAGWDQPENYRTLRVGNLDSDTHRELCGRSDFGMYCANFL